MTATGSVLSAQGGTAVSRRAFSSILRLLDTRGGARASARRLRAALAGLQGCFYGLSRVERRVIILRTGLRGGRSHSRTDVARRLGTSRGHVRRVERRAVHKLYELVQTDGCAGPSGGGAGIITGDGLIGPADLAAAPGLVAFGDPAHQASAQVDLTQPDFSRLGKRVDFPSPSPAIGRFNDGSGNGILWALQLLAVMLLVALGGFTRAAPLIAARARPRVAALRRRYGLAVRRPLRAKAGRPAWANGRSPGRSVRAAAPNGTAANGRTATAGREAARPGGGPAWEWHEEPDWYPDEGTAMPERALEHAERRA